MKRSIQALLPSGRLLTNIALVAVGVALLLLYRLASLTNGVSPGEAVTLRHGITLGDMYHNPLNLPLTFLQWLSIGVTHSHSVWLLRLPSVLLATAALVVFGLLLRRWYGVRTAIFGSVIFAFSPWFLHAGRLGSVDAEQLFAVPMAVFALVQLNRAYDKAWVLYGSTVVLSLLLYIPGMVWFIGLALILQSRDIWDGLKRLRSWKQRLLYPLAWLAPLSLLLLAFVHTPSLWRPWLALPQHVAAPLVIVKHVGLAVLAFVWHGPNNPAMWLDRLPLLNVFTMAMVFVGAIFYTRHWLAPRTRLLFFFFLISIVLYALGGSATLSFAVPIVYGVAAAGIGYLLHEWLTVFPRNPLARSIGIVLIVATLSLSCLYNVRQYFIAWPHNPTTQATFHRLQ